MEDAGLLELLADALRYPEASAAGLGARCAEAIRSMPDRAGDLARFAAATDGQPIEQLQERFVGTFDFDPKRSLDIGWHLFGENYNRGDFLVRMRELLTAHGIAEGGDLPDHLPQLLRLLARMRPDEAGELARTAVLPAVNTLLDGLTDPENPYTHVMTCVRSALSHLANAPAGEASHV